MEKITRKKKLGGYPAIGVVLSTTLALFVMGLFGMLIIYSHELEQIVRENVRMQVYLKPNITETQRLQIENKLLAMDFVKNQGNRAITFVSKDEAAKKFVAETGEEFTKFIGDNPLKDAFLVTIDPDFHSKEEMERIKTDIQQMAGVFEVFYIESLIESINNNVTKIGLVLAGFITILLITVILLINNTLRLALFSQRFLIRSMQLVGAKHWFIRKPFVYRAAGFGFLAAVLASVALWALTHYATGKIEDLHLLQNREQFIMLCAGLAIIGIVISVTSTIVSISNYLRMSLDELY